MKSMVYETSLLDPVEVRKGQIQSEVLGPGIAGPSRLLRWQQTFLACEHLILKACLFAGYSFQGLDHPRVPGEAPQSSR